MTQLPSPSESSDADATLVATGKPTKPAKPPKPPKAPRRRASDKAAGPFGGRWAGCLAALFNVLAALFLLLSVLGVLAVVAVYNGALAYVPGGSAYLPPTEPVIIRVAALPTLPGGTALVQFPTLPPEWTPTITPTITLTPLPGTASPVPSGTLAVPPYTATHLPTPTATATRRFTGPTPKPTFTRAPNNYTFTLQPGSPTYLTNFINTSGCNWFGIVGRAFGLDGNPVINLTVHLEGGGINADTVTGSGPSAMGPGSYELPISDHPIQTTNTYQVQLRNNTGTNLSDVYAIPTYGDCSKNLVMVNFAQNH